MKSKRAWLLQLARTAKGSREFPKGFPAKFEGPPEGCSFARVQEGSLSCACVGDVGISPVTAPRLSMQVVHVVYQKLVELTRHYVFVRAWFLWFFW